MHKNITEKIIVCSEKKTENKKISKKIDVIYLERKGKTINFAISFVKYQKAPWKLSDAL